MQYQRVKKVDIGGVMVKVIPKCRTNVQVQNGLEDVIRHNLHLHMHGLECVGIQHRMDSDLDLFHCPLDRIE